MSIVAVGDNCMDVYPELGRAFPGGNALNVAVYGRRLGSPSAYVGFVGNDDHGECLREAIRKEGVDCSHLHTVPGRTAITQVTLRQGERIFGDYDEGVLAEFRLSRADLDFIGGFQGVHSGFWGRASPYFSQFRTMGLTTFFDFADHLDRQIVEPLLPAVDYAFVSCPEPGDSVFDLLKWSITKGPKAIVATLGKHGSVALDAKGLHRIGIVPVEVVDTMGAGDSYIAGFMVRILEGGTLAEAMMAGTENASKTISVFGAW